MPAPGDVLRVSEAARALPIRTADALGWLRSRGLVHDLLGREVVIWADVLVALREGVPAAPPPTTRPRLARSSSL